MNVIEVTIDDVKDVLDRLRYFYNDTLLRVRVAAALGENIAEVRQEEKGLLREIAHLKSALDGYKSVCVLPGRDLTVSAAEEYIHWQRQGIYLLSDTIPTDAEEQTVNQLMKEILDVCATRRFKYSGESFRRFVEFNKERGVSVP